MRKRGKTDERHDAFLGERQATPDSAAGEAPGARGTFAPGCRHKLITDYQRRAAGTLDPGEGWLNLGPTTVRNGQAATRPNVSGRVNAIALAGNRVWVAASNGGVWRSTGGGEHWESMMQAKPFDRSFDENPEYYMADSLACGAIARGSGQRLYVGTGEGYGAHDSYFGVGPLSSDDGGETWKREYAAAGSPSLDGRGFYEIAAAPVEEGTQPDLVFAATKDGLYRREKKKTERGFHWVRQPVDVGTPVTSVVISRGMQDLDVASESDSRASAVVYAAVHNGDVYWWDTEKEGKFELLGGGFPGVGPGRISLAVRPTAFPKVVYALTEPGELYRFGPATLGAEPVWKAVKTGLPGGHDWKDQGSYNLAIACDPLPVAPPRDGQLAKERIYIGMARVCTSSDGKPAELKGNTCPGVWSGALYRCEVTPGDSPSMSSTYIGGSLHADIHALEFDESNRLWVCCDGGVFQSKVPPAEATPEQIKNLFTARNDDLDTLTLQHLGQHPVEPKTLYCGCQDNGCLQYDCEGVWDEIHDGDAGAVLVKATDNGTVVLASGSKKKVYKRSEAGKWRDVPLVLGEFTVRKGPEKGKVLEEKIEFYPPLVNAPDDPDLVACGSERVWINRDFGGGKWESIPDRKLSKSRLCKDGSETVRSLVFASKDKLYAGTTMGQVFRYLYRATDKASPSQKTWGKERLAELPGGRQDRSVTCIAVDPSDKSGDSIYVTLGGRGIFPRVYRFDGEKWEARNGKGEHHLLKVQHNAIVVHPDYPRKLYVGADIGVWRSEDSGETWKPFSKGLPDAAVLDLKIWPPSPPSGLQDNESSARAHEERPAKRRRLRAATHGRGAFEYVLDFVDVLCVVDGESLLELLDDESGTTETNPRVLDSSEMERYCRMVDRIVGNAQGDLIIGDFLRWRATSLTADEVYDAKLVAFGDCDHPLHKQPVGNKSKNDLLEAEILQQGSGKYALTFKVAKGDKAGYFKWPARIDVGGNGERRSDPAATGMGSRKSYIDILCVVDGKSLFEGFPNAKSKDSAFPLTGENGIDKYCRMITRARDCLRFNAKHNLEVTAKPNTRIVWRAVSLTHDSEYKVDIEAFYDVESTLYSEPKQRTEPKDDPNGKKLDVWESTTQGIEGSDNYYVIFTVEHGGEKLWFDWDPVITVKK